MRNTKDHTEKRFLEYVVKEKDQGLAFLLIFYFLMLNWSSIKEIKDSLALIQNMEEFSANKTKNKYNDNRIVKS